MALAIAYLDGPRLARSMVAASEWVAAGREEINRINVFPVPDGDTGTNLSLTLRSVADALRGLGDAPLPETTGTIARAAVLGAHGNSGMMLAHFFLGVSEALAGRTAATARDLAAALRMGSTRIAQALDRPREGTILTVAREVADLAEREAESTPDLREFLRRLWREGERSVARTPTLLETLRQAGVVDAGGLGFVRMFEGVVRLIEGDPLLPAPLTTGLGPAAAAMVDVEHDQDYRFCTEVVVRTDALPPANEVRAVMHGLGGSVVVLATEDILKVHVHTDHPEAVFTAARRWGELTASKAEDMREQHQALRHPDRRAVAVVTDSAADLPDQILDRHGIAMVPLQVVFGSEVFADRVGLRPEEFYAKLRTAEVLPTTSQPAVGDFVRTFRSAVAEADEVVAVLVSGVLSGTFQAGVGAARAAGLDQVHVVDSRTASLGTGLLALRAAELAAEGWPARAIVTELERLKEQCGVFLTVDQYENLLRSGRVSRGRAWLGGMLDVKPILSLGPDGQILPVGRARGQEALLRSVLELLDERLTPRPARLRLGVVHADAPALADRVREALLERFDPLDCFVSLATGVLGTHVGPGAWAIFYQVEDGSEAPDG